MKGNENTSIVTGMTLRDYFAAGALQGMCTQAPALIASIQADGGDSFDWRRHVAVNAYMLADEMLKLRK